MPQAPAPFDISWPIAVDGDGSRLGVGAIRVAAP
jgi:hypothetical protein